MVCRYMIFTFPRTKIGMGKTVATANNQPIHCSGFPDNTASTCAICQEIYTCATSNTLPPAINPPIRMPDNILGGSKNNIDTTSITNDETHSGMASRQFSSLLSNSGTSVFWANRINAYPQLPQSPNATMNCTGRYHEVPQIETGAIKISIKSQLRSFSIKRMLQGV